MIQIDLKSRKPIYEQVVDGFKRLIQTGAINPDERVPSVRDLAKSLLINPNTIQKAYRELENQGYFYTVLGQGSFVCTRDAMRDSEKLERLWKAFKETVDEMLFHGADKDRMIAYIEGMECGIK